MKRRGGTWTQRWRVPLGFICAIIFLVFAQPGPRILIIGALVALIGLALRAWASGHIRKNSQLATTGPYAYTRNPLYLGSFLIGLGFSIASGRWVLGLIFAALFLGIYFPVMRVESADLAGLFGEDYERYSRAVPLFFPKLWPYREERSVEESFDPSLYLRYREYRATLGFIAAWALLALRAMLIK